MRWFVSLPNGCNNLATNGPILDRNETVTQCPSTGKSHARQNSNGHFRVGSFDCGKDADGTI